MKVKNISWINYIRLICMFFVYFYHAENRAHFRFLDRNFDVFFEPFFVNTFFVVSGYLLYKKQEQIYQRVQSVRDWFNEYGVSYLKNIVFTLMIPSVLFTSILFFPKIFLRRQEFNICIFLEQTIGGGSLWFVAALAVAQFLIFVLLFFRKLSLLLWGLFGVACLLIAVLLHRAGYENAPWYYQSGMCAVFLIWFGALIFKIEKNYFFWFKPLWIIMFVVYTVLVYNLHSLAIVGNVVLNVQGIVLCFMSSLILIAFCGWLKPNKYVDKIGRSTIGLYFLSGAIPEIVFVIVKRFTELNNYIFFFMVIVSFLVSVVLNEIILKYAGFLLDLRKIWKKG